ncbi:MAG: glycogen debranching enzyme N-terminal domain-containing protein, partial [Desulfobacteraceae bacterium]|nr:glycogen debranching enzyme N-terminal domain-containing protein [Desulfobacteraceae bacterium]
LDAGKPVTASWDAKQSPFLKNGVVDLLTGQNAAAHLGKRIGRLDLAPGQVVCLADALDPWLATDHHHAGAAPPAAIRQRLRAKVLEVANALQPGLVPDMEPAVALLQRDPEDLCRQCHPSGNACWVIPWHFPADLRRQVMVPPGHLLLVRAPHAFRARIVSEDRILATEQSLGDVQGGHFILFTPWLTPKAHQMLQIEISLFDPQGARHFKSQLLYLAHGRLARVRTTFSRNDCHAMPLLVLGTNGRGAMMRVHADWGLQSRYDAWLAANLNPDFPEDRRVLLARCRAWVVYQGYSQEIKLDCLEQFAFDYTGGAMWRYQIHTGQGEHVVLQVNARMDSERPNTFILDFERLLRLSGQAELDDPKAVTLIVRPDVEDRNFHHCTKAFTGPEHQWPAAVKAFKTGFRFAPTPGYGLVMQADRGQFHVAPEWYYMVYRPLEAERGLDPDSDLFGPGYFSCKLLGGDRVVFTAQAAGADTETPKLKTPLSQPPFHEDLPLETAMTAALDQYVVRRGTFHTVLAGFPWFLDWGRDTLIVVRGLIAAGRLETSRAILMQFAQFEQHGTLPNMIRGNDASNRDTSDAPLWFFTACADLHAVAGQEDFLEQECNGRTIRRILMDMATAIMAGTPNGIVMDPASGLLYSPSHFTWMDTNFPAGTPRQGYPIEIQALWYAALNFLSHIDASKKGPWGKMAKMVKESIRALFWLPESGYLSDCRHAQPGQGATQALADDALRPNQLLAITLGAVDDPAMIRSILRACLTLLVPGAIRSLADQPVTMPLEVRREGQLLNDPLHPYWGHYQGDEDTRRKPAYHNGTAWTWPFPSFCEAWAMCYGPDSKETALAWLSSSIGWINSLCVGQVPEIVDGDAPHRQRGCDAQAWGVSELLRVWKKLI